MGAGRCLTEEGASGKKLGDGFNGGRDLGRKRGDAPVADQRRRARIQDEGGVGISKVASVRTERHRIGGGEELRASTMETTTLLQLRRACAMRWQHLWRRRLGFRRWRDERNADRGSLRIFKVSGGVRRTDSKAAASARCAHGVGTLATK